MQDWLDIFDLVLPPFYLIIVFIIANIIKNRYVSLQGNEHYQYFLPALTCKIIGGISLCLIYTFYYSYGGDVTNYFVSARTYTNVLFDGNFELFSNMVHFQENNIHLTGYLTKGYGTINFSQSDYNALFTTVLIIPLCILGCKSYIATTIILSSISFIGIWKLYLVFIDHFPNLKKQLAIAILFIPSVFFWGSGLLKDTICIMSIGLYTYYFYRFFILKHRKTVDVLMIIMASLFIVLIKPYILLALLPGSLIWINFNRIQRIQSPILKTLFIPILLVGLFGIIYALYNAFSSYLGEYSLDNIFHKAVKTQQDLIRSQYGSNYHDIGKFDASLSGVISKIPAALNMALFRPYIWNANNPVMLLSGLENLFTLVFTIYIVLRVKFTILIKSLFSHPLIVFSLLFALFFAFSVGLTTANYGALVRLKIPSVPFYISALFMIYELNKASMQRKLFV